MAHVVSLVGFTPPPRYDGLPFVSARVDESADSDTWVAIATVPLSPVDTDPTNPAAHNLTVSTAVLEQGWYRVAFIDAAGNFSVTEPIFRSAESDGSTLATIADVRRVMKLRGTTVIPDEDLAWALEVATSYLQPRLKPYGEPGGTMTYYSVRGSEFLPLPIPGAQVTAVRAQYTHGAAPWALTPLYTPFYVVTSTEVRLLLNSTDRYDTVEVDWTTDLPVPAALREGVAMFAASLYMTNTKLLGGTRSEHIGDYSYQLADKDVDDVMPARAKKLLGPFLRRTRVFVTP